MSKTKKMRRCLDIVGRGPISGTAIALAAMTPLALWSASPARAEVEERVVEDPPRLELRKRPLPRMTLMPRPKPGPRAGEERQLDLNIVYTDSQLYNPATGKYDKVRLRSYVGTDTNPNRPFVAPTIEVTPGDTVRITLNNKLPTDPSCPSPDGNVNTPHCFNSTNLHGHGLWVSPAGNGDNVLLTINPGVSFQYEYNLPPDHPAGTYWYHSHLHGSTALQVSSGMAGALIVRGDRLPSDTANGDIDTLLKHPDGKPLRERVLVLQQIQYACLDENGHVMKDGNGQVVWNCPEGTAGIQGVESYDQFGPGSWPLSGRYTSINGAVLPTFKAKAGEIERWRMIHAGVRDTISLEFRRLKADAPRAPRLKSVEVDRFIGDNCVGDPIPYHVIAEDGLTRAAAWQTSVTVLQPGYRSDALVVFPEAGPYCVIDTSAPAAASVSQSAESRQLLGVVVAAPGQKVQDVHAHLTKQLVAAAQRTMPASIRSQVVADLKDGLKLTRFTPHPDIADSEVTGKQELAFFIDLSKTPFLFEVSNDLGSPPDYKPYDPSRIDRNLTLGGVDEWTLQSHLVSHPFHIHINPFQIVKILDPNGKDVSLPGAVDDAGGTPDPQYPGLKGVWKDTLWVKSLIPPGASPQSGVYTLVVRTRYQRYIGEYVLHCHILDHEDRGMMQNVRVGIPDGKGGTTVAAHH
jgi:L-ascorbate oxidase